jgi:ketosteroid isomerase-like protein
MSRENVEIVRELYDAAARRDAAAVFALYDPEVELDASGITLGGLIGQPVRHGHEGVRSYLHDLHEAWDDLDYDLEELIPAGEQVISFITRRGRGRSSGIAVEMSYAIVWTLREGRIVRLVWFPSHEEALKALGLEG